MVIRNLKTEGVFSKKYTFEIYCDKCDALIAKEEYVSYSIYEEKSRTQQFCEKCKKRW